MTNLPAGTRVRMKHTVPWPERAGCEGVIVVAPNGPGIYPDDLRDHICVLVLLDDDPLGYSGIGHTWTCAVPRNDVEVVE